MRSIRAAAAAFWNWFSETNFKVTCVITGILSFCTLPPLWIVLNVEKPDIVPVAKHPLGVDVESVLVYPALKAYAYGATVRKEDGTMWVYQIGPYLNASFEVGVLRTRAAFVRPATPAEAALWYELCAQPLSRHASR